MMKNREFFPKEEKNNSSLFQKERKIFSPTPFQKYIVCYSLFNFLIFFFNFSGRSETALCTDWLCGHVMSEKKLCFLGGPKFSGTVQS